MRSTCRRCKGDGHIVQDPCKKCNGKGAVDERKTVTVPVPAGEAYIFFSVTVVVLVECAFNSNIKAIDNLLNFILDSGFIQVGP